MKTRAAIMYEPNQPVVVEEIELDEPKSREVLVKMAATGVCHSDLSAVRGVIRYEEPTVLGHEGAGTIVEVGPDVTSVKPGQHIMLAFIAPCGRCFQCSNGHPSICDRHWRDTARGALFDGTHRFHKGDTRFMHFSRVAAMSEYTVVSEDAVIAIDDDIPMDKAALVSCGVMTGVGAVTNTANVELGSTVAVIGIGGAGINVIQGAVLRSASQIIAIDVSPERLQWAAQLGATHTLNAQDNDPVKQVMQLTNGAGVNYAFEAIGKSITIEQSFRMLRAGGTAVIIGITGSRDLVRIPAQMLPAGERRIVGSMYGSARVKTDMPRLLDLYRKGRLKLDELVSKTWQLDQINEAFAEMESGHGLRGLIVFDN